MLHSTMVSSLFAALLVTLTSASPIPQAGQPDCITLPVIYNGLENPFNLALVYPESPMLNDLLVHIPLPDDSSDPYGAPQQLFVPLIGSVAERDDFVPSSAPVLATLKDNGLYQEGYASPAQFAPSGNAKGLEEVFFQNFGLLDPTSGGFYVAYACGDDGDARQELFVEGGSNFCLKNVGGEEGSGDEKWAVLIKTSAYDPAIDGICEDVRLSILY